MARGQGAMLDDDDDELDRNLLSFDVQAILAPHLKERQSLSQSSATSENMASGAPPQPADSHQREEDGPGKAKDGQSKKPGNKNHEAADRARFEELVASTKVEQLVWVTYRRVKLPGILMDKGSASMTNCEVGKCVVEGFPMGKHTWVKYEVDRKEFPPYNHGEGGVVWSKSSADRGRKQCISEKLATGKAWDQMMEMANQFLKLVLEREVKQAEEFQLPPPDANAEEAMSEEEQEEEQSPAMEGRGVKRGGRSNLGSRPMLRRGDLIAWWERGTVNDREKRVSTIAGIKKGPQEQYPIVLEGDELGPDRDWKIMKLATFHKGKQLELPDPKLRKVGDFVLDASCNKRKLLDDLLTNKKKAFDKQRIEQLNEEVAIAQARFLQGKPMKKEKKKRSAGGGKEPEEGCVDETTADGEQKADAAQDKLRKRGREDEGEKEKEGQEEETGTSEGSLTTKPPARKRKEGPEGEEVVAGSSTDADGQGLGYADGALPEDQTAELPAMMEVEPAGGPSASAPPLPPPVEQAASTKDHRGKPTKGKKGKASVATVEEPPAASQAEANSGESSSLPRAEGHSDSTTTDQPAQPRSMTHGGDEQGLLEGAGAAHEDDADSVAYDWADLELGPQDATQNEGANEQGEEEEEEEEEAATSVYEKPAGDHEKRKRQVAKS